MSKRLRATEQLMRSRIGYKYPIREAKLLQKTFRLKAAAITVKTDAKACRGIDRGRS
jgi:hypothetical protein